MHNGKKDRVDRIEELLNIAAAQTAETANRLNRIAKLHARGKAEHDRGMKEIRSLFKKMIKRIAV